MDRLPKDETAISDRDKLLSLARLVKRYRDAKLAYSRNRSTQGLADSIKLGELVDLALQDVLGPEATTWNKM